MLDYIVDLYFKFKSLKKSDILHLRVTKCASNIC